MSKLTTSPAWEALKIEREKMDARYMRDLFAADPDRFNRYSFETCGLLLDYSKNRITDDSLSKLFDLARFADVEGWRQRLFAGEAINQTENRAALHPALRAPASEPYMANGKDLMEDIKAVREKMRSFSDAVRNGSRIGATGKPITDVINIGIGGSDLGPRMVTHALQSDGPNIHFVSNVDSTQIAQTLSGLSWESTIFIVASKTFTTQETMLNAEFARQWLSQESGRDDITAEHFFALTAKPEQAKAFGISEDGIFEFWDWVGGRYSLWSSVGLTIALAIGMDGFEESLQGAHAMDIHFQTAPLEQNMPVILALLGIWYINFFDAHSHAIVPYNQNLEQLADYLQQADMESNGKRVNRNGEPVDYATAPVIWGNAGTNAQHSFFQKLHQGTEFVPVDFIAAASSGVETPLADKHHDVLLANFLAQAEALMTGNETSEPHKSVPGNRPSNALVCEKLDAKTLGSLIALYEHKIFVQGIIWDINSFDQWGVEIGKQLAGNILPDLESDAPATSHDASTNGLINTLKKLKD